MYTLGEWTIEGDHIVARMPNGDLLNCGADGKAHSVAIVFGPDASDNVRLIKVVPRLLAACEAVFEWSQQPSAELWIDLRDGFDEMIEQVIDALRAAGSACVDDASLEGNEE